MQRFSFTLLALMVVAFGAKAQDADVAMMDVEPITAITAIETDDKSDDDEEDNGISITGFVDAYYQYNSNGTGLLTSFTESTDEFSLGMANVVFAKESGKVGFVADLAFGPRAEVANGGSGTLTAIKQLYVTYSPSEKISFTVGNFSTFLGYELIDAPGNVNYSTSYLFSNGPFYHTGAKVDVVLGENFGAMLGVFNDTDSKTDEVAGKHIGAQLSAEVGGLSAYLNFIYGKEAEIEDSADDLQEMEIDLTAGYEVSDKLYFGLNVANYATTISGENVGGFFGSALYSTITTSETFALGLRAEYFTPTDGDDRTDDTSILSLTASGNINLGDLRIIPEFRFDSASEDFFFPSEDGEATDGSMTAFILAAVYSF